MCLAKGRDGPIAVQIVGEYGLVWDISGATAVDRSAARWSFMRLYYINHNISNGYCRHNQTTHGAQAGWFHGGRHRKYARLPKLRRRRRRRLAHFKASMTPITCLAMLMPGRKQLLSNLSAATSAVQSAGRYPRPASSVLPANRHRQVAKLHTDSAVLFSLQNSTARWQ